MAGITPRSYKMRSSNLGNTGTLPLCASDAERFWAKVRRSGEAECWPWTASAWKSGYGQFGVQLPGSAGKRLNVGAHRVAWALSHGPVPDGAWVLHRCDNRLCCNPAHLFLGDHAANMADASAKGRLSVPRPARQQLSDEQIADIVALVRGGMKRYRVAELYGVTKAYVGMVVSGKRRQFRAPATQQQEVA
jgi:hypothetical protein